MYSRWLYTVMCFGILACLIACSKTAKAVVIGSDGEVMPVTLTLQEGSGLPKLWEPGIVVLFHTADKVPEGIEAPENGAVRAGEAYVVTEGYKLRKIGDFDLKRSNEELGEMFASYR